MLAPCALFRHMGGIRRRGCIGTSCLEPRSKAAPLSPLLAPSLRTGASPGLVLWEVLFTTVPVLEALQGGGHRTSVLCGTPSGMDS